MSLEELAQETDGLDVVKAGDWVAVDNGGLTRSRVTKVTTAQIHCDGTAYWKKNGRQVGSANSYHVPAIYPMTPHRQQVIRRRELACVLNGKNWIAYPLETLETVWSLVEAARKAKEAGR